MDIDEYNNMEETFEGRGSWEVKKVGNESEEIVKSREEARSRIPDHKSDSNDYYRDGHSNRGNESRVRFATRDSLEIIKSRETIWSHNLDHKNDRDCDRDGHSNRFKYSNESRIRVANRDFQENIKSRELVRSHSLDHKSDDSDYDRGGHSKRFNYDNEFRIRKANRDRRETMKFREDVMSHCLDHKSDDSDYERDGHSKRFKHGNEFKFRDRNKDGQETMKFREEVRSHSLDHKSDDSDYHRDGHPKLFKYDNEFKTHDANRDGQETIKSRQEVHSHSLDHKTDDSDYDRDVRSKLFKYGNESRIRDVNRDGVKLREEVRICCGDYKSDSNDDIHSKRIKYGNESRIHDPSSGADSSRHRSIYRDGDKERLIGRAEHWDMERDRDRRMDREDTHGRDRERYRDRGREKEWNRKRERRGREHDGERDKDVDREREHSCRSGTPSKSYLDPGETETARGKDYECEWERRGRDHDDERGADVDREKGYSRISGAPSESYQDRDETEKSTGKEYRQMDKESIEGDNKCSREKEDGADLEIDLLPCSRTKEDRADLETDLSSCSRTEEDSVDLEANPECDQRTVFAYKISLKADKRDVYEFFSKAGKVQDVHLIMDSNPGISEGFWCIEFSDTMSVPMAIELSGQSLLGQPVVVKPSESENNLMQSTTAAADAGGLTEPYSEGPGRLYVGNLHVNIREDQLLQIFEPFGKVEFVRLSMDRSERCRGFGFVQFTRLKDARNALTLDGNLEIAGRIIKVSAITSQTRTLDVGANNADFVRDGYALSSNAHCLEILVQKLDRDGTLSSISDILKTPIINSIGAPNLGTASFVSAQTLVQNSILAPPILLGTSFQVPAAEIPSIDTIGTPSECLLLNNMFDPKLETDPKFFLDVREDVREECSRFGNLKHVFVEKKSAGLVYIRFDNIKSAISAQHALHGRWLSGNMVTATFVDPRSYETKFPRSR